MRERREIMTHGLMVVAPLVMLAALTAAWFINSNTMGLSTLSFASQNTGPGAALHFGTAVKEKRRFDGAVTPNTLENTVLWGKEEQTEDSAIVIENMVPGQCEYYLLVSEHPITVSLSNVSYTDAEGKPPAVGETLPLTQCLGFYLLPVSPEELEAFDWSKVGETPENGAPTSTPGLALARDEQGQLAHAALKDMPATALLTPEGWSQGDTPACAYILAIYCDPLYLQTPETDTAYTPVNTLAGAVSFSLAFPKEGVE